MLLLPAYHQYPPAPQLLCYCHLQVFFSSLITTRSTGKHAALTLYSDKRCCSHVTHWRCNIISSPAMGYNWTSTVKFSKLLLTQMWKIFEKLSGKKGKNKTSLLLENKKKSLSFYLLWSDSICSHWQPRTCQQGGRNPKAEASCHSAQWGIGGLGSFKPQLRTPSVQLPLCLPLLLCLRGGTALCLSLRGRTLQGVGCHTEVVSNLWKWGTFLSSVKFLFFFLSLKNR